MDYFGDVIKKCIARESSIEEDKTFVLSLTIQAKSLNTDNIKKLLDCNGFDVVSICKEKENEVHKESCYDSNIGKKVVVSQNIVIANNILMKTQHSLYKIAKVVLPKNLIGIVSDIKDNKYLVDFSASLDIDPRDIVEGYDSTPLTYNLDTYLLDSNQIEFI